MRVDTHRAVMVKTQAKVCWERCPIFKWFLL